MLSAELLRLSIIPTFEPTGEELGTQYEYSCPICKAGRIVKEELKVSLSRIPKRTDMAKTIAQDEWVVSDKLSKLIITNGIQGANLAQVRNKSRRKSKDAWQHLTIKSQVLVDERTKYGDPFNPIYDTGNIISSCGHTINQLILSELFLKRRSWDKSDVARTNLYFGGHMNLVYPWPAIIISARFYRILIKNKIKGYEVEIAHLI